MLMIV